MAAIAIVGKSGTGKSTSLGNIPELGIKGLNPEETVIINIAGKDLPFKGSKKIYGKLLIDGGNYHVTSSAPNIVKAITYIETNRPEIKNIVIDDAQFIMAFEFMDKADKAGYAKFVDIGVNISNVIKAARNSTKKVFFLWHPEEDMNGNMKMKSVGKMVDNYLTLEGLFTVILYTLVKKEDDKIQYRFITNNIGELPAKSPVGMFEIEIPNDLGYVIEKMDEYYN